MEYIIGLILALVGGLFFYKNKADKASVDGKLAETRGRDKELELSQEELEKQIAELDKGIEKMKADREAKKIKEDNMTLAERRERIKKGLKND